MSHPFLSQCLHLLVILFIWGGVGFLLFKRARPRNRKFAILLFATSGLLVWIGWMASQSVPWTRNHLQFLDNDPYLSSLLLNIGTNIGVGVAAVLVLQDEISAVASSRTVRHLDWAQFMHQIDLQIRTGSATPITICVMSTYTELLRLSSKKKLLKQFRQVCRDLPNACAGTKIHILISDPQEDFARNRENTVRDLSHLRGHIYENIRSYCTSPDLQEFISLRVTRKKLILDFYTCPGVTFFGPIPENSAAADREHIRLTNVSTLPTGFYEALFKPLWEAAVDADLWWQRNSGTDISLGSGSRPHHFLQIKDKHDTHLVFARHDVLRAALDANFDISEGHTIPVSTNTVLQNRPYAAVDRGTRYALSQKYRHELFAAIDSEHDLTDDAIDRVLAGYRFYETVEHINAPESPSTLVC